MAKLQIEFIHNVKSGHVIQTRPFKFGIRVTNIDFSPFLGAIAKDIKFRSAAGQNIVEPIEKEFHIAGINPDQCLEIWMGNLGTYMHGLAHMELKLVSDNVGDDIFTYQKNKFTGDRVSGGAKNTWIDFFYIRTLDEYTRDNTNNFLLIITISMALMTVMQIYLTKKQTNYAALQSIPEQINQAKLMQEAIEFCKTNPPDTQAPSIYYLDGSGKSALCKDLLK